MTSGVVYSLEVVEIDHKERQGNFESKKGVIFAIQGLAEPPEVEYAGQRVLERHLLETIALLFERLLLGLEFPVGPFELLGEGQDLCQRFRVLDPPATAFRSLSDWSGLTT